VVMCGRVRSLKTLLHALRAQGPSPLVCVKSIERVLKTNFPITECTTIDP